MAKNLTTLVVLNDGETFSAVGGCSMIVVTLEQLEQLNNGTSPKDIQPVLEIGLMEYHDKNEDEE